MYYTLFLIVCLLYLQMNVVLASSRGKDLKLKDLPEGTVISVTHGGLLSELRSEAENFIPPPYGPCKRRMHIYFLCGIPNITKLIKSHKYKECVYDEESDITVNRYHTELKNCQESILKHGALPIFATITRINIANFNNFLYTHGKTSCLQLSENYKDMQENVDKTIDAINHHIYELNKKNRSLHPISPHKNHGKDQTI